MVGYASIGRLRIAMVPPSVIRMAMTHAKIGRSMKNCGMGSGRVWLAEGRELSCVNVGAGDGKWGRENRVPGWIGTVPDKARTLCARSQAGANAFQCAPAIHPHSPLGSL